MLFILPAPSGSSDRSLLVSVLIQSLKALAHPGHHRCQGYPAKCFACRTKRVTLDVPHRAKANHYGWISSPERSTCPKPFEHGLMCAAQLIPGQTF
jgi:hypothetical protein